MMNREEILAKAKELGVKHARNATDDVILVLIEEAEMAKVAEKFDKPEDLNPTDDKSTQTQTSSINKQNVLKPMTPKKSKAIRNANQMVRCIITPLDESMRTINSEMYSVGTPETGFVKKVVRFNEETIETAITVRHLLGKKMLLQQDAGKGHKVKMKHIPAFNIKILPDYTEKELKELFAKGKASR